LSLHDNGSEFTKLNLEDICDSYGLKRKQTTIKNPQTNAILERIHQVVDEDPQNRPNKYGQAVTTSDIDAHIYMMQHGPFAQRTTQYLKPPQVSQFERDMLFDIPYIANWTIGERRLMLTDRNNVRENKTRRDFDHEVGIKVLIDHESLRKAESPYEKNHGLLPRFYGWNYQGSTRSKNGKIKYPESKVIPRKLRGIDYKLIAI
jgi:hypothetical protein